jgi:WhiB family redox-sensing transcriptional regulator
MEIAWEQIAACRGLDSTLFYPGEGDGTGAAQRICASCPVAEACLEHAIAHREKDGIWGGTTPIERQRIIRRRRRQRRLQLINAS